MRRTPAGQWDSNHRMPIFDASQAQQLLLPTASNSPTSLNPTPGDISSKRVLWPCRHEMSAVWSHLTLPFQTHLHKTSRFLPPSRFYLCTMERKIPLVCASFPSHRPFRCRSVSPASLTPLPFLKFYWSPDHIFFSPSCFFLSFTWPAKGYDHVYSFFLPFLSFSLYCWLRGIPIYFNVIDVECFQWILVDISRIEWSIQGPETFHQSL